MVATKLHVRLQNSRDARCCRQNSATTQKLQDTCVSSAPVVGSLETGSDLCWFIYVSLKASLATEIGAEGSRCDLVQSTVWRVAEITVAVRSTMLGSAE